MAGVRELSYLSLTAFFTVVLIIIARTVMYSHQPTAAYPCKPSDLDYINVDEDVKRRFQTALSIQTVSWNVGNYNREELHNFLQFILKGEDCIGKIYDDFLLFFLLYQGRPFQILADFKDIYKYLQCINWSQFSLALNCKFKNSWYVIAESNLSVTQK